MENKKWFEKLGENKSIQVVKGSVKYFYKYSRMYDTHIDENGNVNTFVMYNSDGKKHSYHLIFNEYDIAENEDPRLASKYREFLMSNMPEEERMEYLYDAMEYLAREADSERHEALEQANANKNAKLDKQAESEWDILELSKDRAKVERVAINKEHLIARRDIENEYDTDIENIAEDLAHSFASSFNPAKQEHFNILYEEAMTALIGQPQNKITEDSENEI
ncbi:MAG: hypothetical protein E7361_02160 [Clostridiales bacterium]|nr:hypothetical protein [Clostridiales bacterium]